MCLKKNKKLSSDYISIITDEKYELDDESSWTVDFWIKLPPNTAWSRLVQGVAKIARHVRSYFKRDLPK